MIRACCLAAAALLALAVAGRADEKPTDAEKAAAAWEYPGAKKLSGQVGGPLVTGVYVTGDDLAKVLKWYGEKLGTDLAPREPTAGGVEGGADKQTASFQDSVRPFDDKAKTYPPRDVAVHVGVQNTKGYAVTVVVSRARGEDHTHVVITYVAKQGAP
jgi:hypothetical protein